MFIFFNIIFFIYSCNLPYRESNLNQNYYQKGLKFTLKTARAIEKENNLELISYYYFVFCGKISFFR
jgi:hypothetical protein